MWKLQKDIIDIYKDNKNLYIYETHLHTSEGSACGHVCATDMVVAYKNAGYTGIIITDHFFYGNTAPDRTLSWQDWVCEYCKGYENAKKKGDEIGLQVFFGWEAGYHGPEFLVYGLDKEWLLAHPEIRDASIHEQYELVHKDGGIVIQAHPFREAPYIPEIMLFPDDVDGVEGINATHTGLIPKRCEPHPEFNERALTYAKEHNFPITAGSDQHTSEMVYGGMVFDHKLNDIGDFKQAVLNREAIAYLDGTRRDIFK